MKETPFLQAHPEMIAQFKSMPFLSSFGETHLKQILTSSKIRIFGEGEIIIEEGANDRWVYILMSGEVTVSRKGGHIANFSAAGEIFGELALVSNDRRSATVVAIRGATCLAIDAAVINTGQEADRAVFLAIIYRLLSETLGQRVRQCNAEISNMRLEIDMLKASLISSKG
jgi:CRP/FNR family transcriptional regulator, cyclic AMP receptor protein